MRRLALTLLLAVACTAAEPAVDTQPRPSPLPDPLTGVVTKVSAVRGGDVIALAVRAGQETYEVLIDPARDYGFDLHHLEEHRETGDPVRVDVEQRRDGAYAVSIEDA